jgi:hypothetical protein
MKIPEEFIQFVGGLYPDLHRDSGSLESLAAAGLEDSDAAERRGLLAFLNKLLDGGHPDVDLEYAWNAQSPTYNFSAGGHRVSNAAFLTTLNEKREAVGYGPVAGGDRWG